MDVHKDTITYAIAMPGRTKAQYRGEIAHKRKTVNKLIERLSEGFSGALLLFRYEAGPTGYHLYRQIIGSGHDCEVVAPSKIPRKSGDLVKTGPLLGAARLNTRKPNGHVRFMPRTGHFGS
jgi:transposase